ncbi:MAG: RNA methyltransferase [Flammeovirgaceae bacterium]|nr:RNA methyltransferase [Flammeovirgaceae bacterium]
MLSKAKIKYIKSLQIKKYRKEEQCFLVEGAKSVSEVLASDFEVITVVGTSEYLSSVKSKKTLELIEANERELSGMGEYSTNNSALAVVRMKPNRPLTIQDHEYALALDDIRDPGNLGTIIRTADWYGINKIIASEETADFYNPKVIAATMGSFCRVRFHYTRLPEFIGKVKVPVLGTFLDGENVHQFKFGKSGLIVIGNESNGISKEVEKLITHRLTIPKYGEAESLNAAIATAVICDNLRSSKF